MMANKDAYALFSAVHRFLVAGGVDCSVVEETLTFSHGTVRVEDAKCWLTFTGTHLPLVLSDLQMPGFVDGLRRRDDRSMVTVHITHWSRLTGVVSSSVWSSIAAGLRASSVAKQPLPQRQCWPSSKPPVCRPERRKKTFRFACSGDRLHPRTASMDAFDAAPSV